MPYIIIVVFIAAFGSGYATAWKHSQAQIVQLETSIQIANKEANDTLVAAQDRIKQERAVAEEKQKKLETDHASVINNNTQLANDLAVARLQYAKAIATAGRSCPVPKTIGTVVSKKVDGGGKIFLSAIELSKELDRVVQAKAPIADQRDEDLHFILEWLNSIPKEQLE